MVKFNSTLSTLTGFSAAFYQLAIMNEGLKLQSWTTPSTEIKIKYAEKIREARMIFSKKKRMEKIKKLKEQMEMELTVEEL